MMEITAERYAELVIAEDKYNRLCEVIKERGWRGLTGEEVRFLRDMFCGKPDLVAEAE